MMVQSNMTRFISGIVDVCATARKDLTDIPNSLAYPNFRKAFNTKIADFARKYTLTHFSPCGVWRYAQTPPSRLVLPHERELLIEGRLRLKGRSYRAYLDRRSAEWQEQKIFLLIQDMPRFSDMRALAMTIQDRQSPGNDESMYDVQDELVSTIMGIDDLLLMAFEAILTAMYDPSNPNHILSAFMKIHYLYSHPLYSESIKNAFRNPLLKERSVPLVPEILSLLKLHVTTDASYREGIFELALDLRLQPSLVIILYLIAHQLNKESISGTSFNDLGTVDVINICLSNFPSVCKKWPDWEDDTALAKEVHGAMHYLKFDAREKIWVDTILDISCRLESAGIPIVVVVDFARQLRLAQLISDRLAIHPS